MAYVCLACGIGGCLPTPAVPSESARPLGRHGRAREGCSWEPVQGVGLGERVGAGVLCEAGRSSWGVSMLGEEGA